MALRLYALAFACLTSIPARQQLLVRQAAGGLAHMLLPPGRSGGAGAGLGP